MFFCAGCRFAYITFDSKEFLFKALELDGLDYNARSLRVDTAGDTGGGGGGGGGSGRGGYGGRGGCSGLVDLVVVVEVIVVSCRHYIRHLRLFLNLVVVLPLEITL